MKRFIIGQWKENYTNTAINDGLKRRRTKLAIVTIYINMIVYQMHANLVYCIKSEADKRNSQGATMKLYCFLKYTIKKRGSRADERLRKMFRHNLIFTIQMIYCSERQIQLKAKKMIHVFMSDN